MDRDYWVGKHLRAGSSTGRTIFIHANGQDQGQLAGVMDTRELAQLVVASVNHYLKNLEREDDHGSS